MHFIMAKNRIKTYKHVACGSWHEMLMRETSDVVKAFFSRPRRGQGIHENASRQGEAFRKMPRGKARHFEKCLEALKARHFGKCFGHSRLGIRDLPFIEVPDSEVFKEQICWR